LAMAMDFHAGHENQKIQNGKKLFCEKAHHQDWDYLKGIGPSAPQVGEKEETGFKPASFKTGWKAKKHEKDIDPYGQRISQENVSVTVEFV